MESGTESSPHKWGWLQVYKWRSGTPKELVSLEKNWVQMDLICTWISTKPQDNLHSFWWGGKDSIISEVHITFEIEFLLQTEKGVLRGCEVKGGASGLVLLGMFIPIQKGQEPGMGWRGWMRASGRLSSWEGLPLEPASFCPRNSGKSSPTKATQCGPGQPHSLEVACGTQDPRQSS